MSTRVQLTEEELADLLNVRMPLPFSRNDLPVHMFSATAQPSDISLAENCKTRCQHEMRKITTRIAIVSMLLMVTLAVTRTNGSPLADVGPIAGAAEQQAPATPARPIGRVKGIVLDAVTDQPIPGTYVAIDSSGDSGGSNLERFEEEGIYVNAETDVQGRFELDGVALIESHPFYATHSGYVRHEQSVSLSSKDPTAEFTVRLRPAGTLNVSVVDRDGNAMRGPFQFRLAADDARRFLPRREDWPNPQFRTEQSDARGRFAFGELDTGTFSVDAFQSILVTTDFVGRVEAISLRAGETASAKIQRSANGSILTVRLEGADSDARTTLLITRDTHLTQTLTPARYHAEDSRLGQVVNNALLQVPLEPGATSYRVTNLPAGQYAVFAVFVAPTRAPAVAIGSSLVEIVEGRSIQCRVEPSSAAVGPADHE
jgi:hypothetical protein